MTGRDYDLKLTDFGVSTRHISLIVKFDQLPPACMRLTVTLHSWMQLIAFVFSLLFLSQISQNLSPGYNYSH